MVLLCVFFLRLRRCASRRKPRRNDWQWRWGKSNWSSLEWWLVSSLSVTLYKLCVIHLCWNQLMLKREHVTVISQEWCCYQNGHFLCNVIWLESQHRFHEQETEHTTRLRVLLFISFPYNANPGQLSLAILLWDWLSIGKTWDANKHTCSAQTLYPWSGSVNQCLAEG